MLDTMINNIALIAALRKCRGPEGFEAIDGIFESCGYKEATFKDKTKVLYSAMGMTGGLGSPSLTDDRIYDLMKDLLASGEWMEFTA